MDARQERGRQIAAIAKITKRSRYVDRSVAIRQRPLRRDHLEGRQVLHLPRLRVAPATLQTRVRREIRLFRETTRNGDTETVTEAAAIRVT
jgi:hypothetical protein